MNKKGKRIATIVLALIISLMSIPNEHLLVYASQGQVPLATEIQTEVEESSADFSEEPTETQSQDVTEESSEMPTEEITQVPTEVTTEDATEELTHTEELKINGIENLEAAVTDYVRIADTSIEWKYESGVLKIRNNNNFSGLSKIPNRDDTDLGFEKYRSNVKKIVIEKGVTEIGNKVFQDYVLLSQVTFPEELEKIGEYTFEGCEKLIGVTFPKNLKSIGKYAFKDCSKIASVKMQNAVTQIGEGIFENNSSLQSVLLSSKLEGIPDKSFYGCINLSTINLPISITAIGNNAFLNCRNLTKLSIPNQVKTIGNAAFFGCSELKTVTLPFELTKIGNDAFNGCSLIEKISIPENVTEIGTGAFQMCQTLTTLNIPESVVKIGAYAFKDCNSLTSVYLPENIMRLEMGTFSGCRQLKTIFMPEALNYIGEECFQQTSSLYYITIPNSVNEIAANAFSQSALKELELSNVKKIGNKAFYDCNLLTSANLGIVETIGNEAFASCDELKEIILPETVTTIGSKAFQNCKALKILAFVGSVSLPADAFENTLNIKTILKTKGVAVNADVIKKDTLAEFTINNGEMEITNISLYNAELDIMWLPNNIGQYPITVFSGGNPNDKIDCSFQGKITSGAQRQNHEWSNGRCKKCKTIQTFKVQFDTQGGEPIEPIVLNIGETVVAIPVREGFTFAGWFDHIDGNGVQYTEYTPIKKDIILYANWEQDAITNQFTIGKIPKQYYTGSAIKPDIKVYDNGVKLNNGKDYTLSYSKNITPGIAKITIKGKGNYASKESEIIEFEILHKSISDKDIEVILTDMEYTGKVLKQNPQLKWKKLSLKIGRDFKIDTQQLVDAEGNPIENTQQDGFKFGRVEVKIVGAGNYTGSRKAYYTIDRGLITKATVKKISDQQYVKGGVEPNLSVKYKSIELIKNEDYKVTFVNNDKIGTATAIIQGIGPYYGTKTVTFKVIAKDVKKDILIRAIPTQKYTGTAVKPIPVVTYDDEILVEMIDYIVTYKNNIIAANVTATNAPTVTIQGKGKYKGTVSAKFSITPKDITDGSITATVADGKYNSGKEVKPAVVLKDGIKTLVSGKDYTLSYSNNKEKNNNATVKAVGKGSYKGEIILTFKIADNLMSESSIIKIGGVPSQLYTGEEICPKPLITYKNIPLTEGDDYTLSYENNINVGSKATIIVTGKTEQTAGIRKITFSITPRSIVSESIHIDEVTPIEFSGLANKPEVVVKDGEKALQKDKDYKLSWINNVNVGNADSKLKPTVKITGVGNYSGSRSIYFNIETTSIDVPNIEISAAEVLYTGKGVKPAVVVKDTDTNRTLTKDKDYTITYENNIDVVTEDTPQEKMPCVIINGKNGYAGSSKKQEFRIYQYSLSSSKTKFLTVKAQKYTGLQITPKPEITYNGEALVEGENFEIVSYGQNQKVGKGTITVKGIGKFGGTKTISFAIIPKGLWSVFN